MPYRRALPRGTSSEWHGPLGRNIQDLLRPPGRILIPTSEKIFWVSVHPVINSSEGLFYPHPFLCWGLLWLGLPCQLC